MMADDDKTTPASEVEIIPPSTGLQKRVPLIEQSVEAAMEKANASLEKLKADYQHWADLDAKALEQAYAALAAAPDSKVCVDDVYRISHDMKGQAGTFDYQLVTDILHNLCRYLEDRGAVNAHQLHVTRLHVDAARLVIDTHADALRRLGE